MHCFFSVDFLLTLMSFFLCVCRIFYAICWKRPKKAKKFQRMTWYNTLTLCYKCLTPIKMENYSCLKWQSKYVNTGCGVFKGGIQNSKVFFFCVKAAVVTLNSLILRIWVVTSFQKLGFILKNKVIQNYSCLKWQSK